MENRTDATPIIFCMERINYKGTAPVISWTSKFSESVPFRRLHCLPIKTIKRYDETMTSVIELDQLSSNSSFFALQPYNVSGVYGFFLDYRCLDDPKNINIVRSENISLYPGGGTDDKISGDKGPYLDYAIFCCVRPKLRCLVNDLPIEILEHIFSSFKPIDYRLKNYNLSKVIPLVCRRWKKVYVAFEGEPIDAKVKLEKLKQIPGKRYMWVKCQYDEDDDINFHEYVDAVVGSQPFLRDIMIYRPLQESPLDGLLMLAKVTTLKNATLYNWNFQKVFDFLQARQHLKLNNLTIYGMTEEGKEVTNVTSSNVKVQSQLVMVKILTIKSFDDSIHKILNCLQKDHLEQLRIWYDGDTFEPLKEPIRLFGFQNLVKLELDGENEESNLISADFISTTCTPSNLPKLHTLSLNYCFFDLTELKWLLSMPELKNVDILLFLGQKTDENEQITKEVTEKLIAEAKHDYTEFSIRYSDGDDPLW